MTAPHHDHGEHWDESDTAALTVLEASGLSNSAIAQVLGRTTSAVSSALYRLRGKPKPVPPPPPPPPAGSATSGGMGKQMSPTQAQAFTTPGRRDGYRIDCLALTPAGGYLTTPIYPTDPDPFIAAGFDILAVVHHTSSIDKPCTPITDVAGYRDYIGVVVDDPSCSKLVCGNEVGLIKQGDVPKAEQVRQYSLAREAVVGLGVEVGGAGILWGQALAAASGRTTADAVKGNDEIDACAEAGVAVAFHAYPSTPADLELVVDYIRKRAPGADVWCNEWGVRQPGIGPSVVTTFRALDVPFWCYAPGGGPGGALPMVNTDGTLTAEGVSITQAIATV